MFVPLLLLGVRGDSSAQDAESWDRIVLWSAQGPIVVQRPTSVATQSDLPPAEHLVQKLLKGPTAVEAEQGLWTAIPPDTALAGVVEPQSRVVVVRLDMPAGALQDLTHEAFETITQQVGKTLLPLDWRDLRIQVRDPASGDFVALADFLPHVQVPSKPTAGLETGLEPVVEEGQPPALGQAQPRGTLSGKTVYVSAGHGWEWNSYKQQWKTQRPPYPSTSYNGPIVEDHNNAEVVNQYLLRYLWNAGAQVWPVRERDMNGSEAVVDDGAAGYWETGWTGVPGGYGGNSREAATVTGTATATARWQAGLPEDGQYGVYVWFRSGADRPADARYTVKHAGGETTVQVDQRHHGHTWHYIGTYGFLAEIPAEVVLTNQSAVSGRTVVADAVRFGGGTFNSLSGIDTVAPGAPNKPWWEVASFYYTQKMGMPAGYGDVTARPVYARWEHAGTDDDAVYISWHSNGATGSAQWSCSGTETYVHNGEGLNRTVGSIGLADAVHNEVVGDIRRGWDASWVDRGRKQANLGELRLLWDDDPSKRMPGALIEIGFHDHPGDTDALREPGFNQLVARAVYQGIARYYDPHATLLPEPPTHLAVENLGGGSVRVSWAPSPTDALDLRGHAPTGYRVYTSTNGVGWSNGLAVTEATDYVLTEQPVGELIFIRVTATNAGGESFPTETLVVRVGDGAQVLVVNGFDRLDRHMGLHENDPVEGENVRMLLDRMNSYDYAVQHGKAIRAASDQAFDSASNEAVQRGDVSLHAYAVVDWILGQQSDPHETLNSAEQALLRSYLDSGGALFISGSEIAHALDHAGSSSDGDFCARYLKVRYAGDDANTSSAQGTVPPLAGLDFRFDAPGMYEVEAPDQLHSTGSSYESLRYSGGLGGTAGVQYADGCRRVISFGFPFETILPQHRESVMSAVLGFLGECLDPTVDTSIASPLNATATNKLPNFHGAAQAQLAALAGVEVQIENISTGKRWNGTGWEEEDVWVNAEGAETWSYNLPHALPDGDYQLRARGRTTTGIRDATPAEVAFTYDTLDPAPTTLVTPTGGITITALPYLHLAWEDTGPDDGSPLSYEIDLDGHSVTTNESYYTTTQILDGVHGWRVRVRDQAGNSSQWTDSATFSVVRTHLALPLVLRQREGPAPGCSNIILNGGFETDGGWSINGPVEYGPANVRSGTRSARIGFLPDEQPVGLEETNWSSVRQTVTLPESFEATLRLWVYPILEGNDPHDTHYISLRDQGDTLYHLELTASDARRWRQGEFELTDFAGQTVTIYVGVQYDNDHHTPAIYVDDVELEVCP